mmetsp:Transcript_8825/g.8176  ORF Transcript_8825/g.8176 Transcript_8825/m.8176 type:complete len:154 (+) Transcript_8825:1460-1921(+)
MDVEAEVDRKLLCERILTQIDLASAKHAMSQTQPVFSSQAVAAPNQETKAVPETGQSQKKTQGGKTPTQKRGQSQLKSSAGFTQNGDEKSVIHGGGGVIVIGGINITLENINIATYVCDFGNVVVGSTKKKSFRLTNVGKIPVTFNFDKKILG